jgi:hypothetical protein
MACPPTIVELVLPRSRGKQKPSGLANLTRTVCCREIRRVTVRIRHECGHVDRTKRRGTTDKQSIAGVRSPTDFPLSVQFRYN